MPPLRWWVVVVVLWCCTASVLTAPRRGPRPPLDPDRHDDAAEPVAAPRAPRRLADGSQSALLKISAGGSVQPLCSVALDSGLHVVGGHLTGSASLPGPGLNYMSIGQGGTDAYVFAYTVSTMIGSWRAAFGSTGNEVITALAVSGNGTSAVVYAAGTTSTSFSVTIPGTAGVSISTGAFVVRMLASSGVVTGAWGQPMTSGNVLALVSLPGSDLLYLGGSFASMTIGGVAKTAAGATGDTDGFVLSLATTAGTWSLVNVVSSSLAGDSVNALALSTDNSKLYACGAMGALAQLPPLVASAGAQGLTDLFLASMPLSGLTAGNWTAFNLGGSPMDDACAGLAVSATSAAVYVLAAAGEGDFVVAGSARFTSSGRGIGLLAYNAASSSSILLSWSLAADSTLTDIAAGLTLEYTSSRVYITGSFSNAINFGSTALTNPNQQPLPFVAVATVSLAAGTWYRAMPLRDAPSSSSSGDTLAVFGNAAGATPMSVYACGRVSSGTLYFDTSGFTTFAAASVSSTPGYCNQFLVTLPAPTPSITPSAAATGSFTSTVTLAPSATASGTAQSTLSGTANSTATATASLSGTANSTVTSSMTAMGTPSAVGTSSGTATASASALSTVSASRVAVVMPKSTQPAVPTAMTPVPASTALAATAGAGATQAAAAPSPAGGTPLPGPKRFDSVTLGGFHGWAVFNGSLTFLGEDTGGYVAAAGGGLGQVVDVSAGGFHTCALVPSSGTPPSLGLRCWGAGPAVSPPVAVITDITLQSVRCGGYSCCAVNATGGINCWGASSAFTAAPPALVAAGASKLAVGGYHACTVTVLPGSRTRAGSGVICWGRDTAGQASGVPPAIGAVTTPAVRYVASGGFHSCSWGTGVGNVAYRSCWGSNASGQTSIPASVPSNVSFMCAGGAYTCAVLPGSLGVTCWGSTVWGETNVPPAARDGPVASLACGWYGACAILNTTSALVCWGGSFGGSAPAGSTGPGDVPRALVISSERSKDGKLRAGHLVLGTGAGGDTPGSGAISLASGASSAFSSGDVVLESRGGRSRNVSGIVVATGLAAGGGSGDIVLSTGGSGSARGAISIAAALLCVESVCLTPDQLALALNASKAA